MSPPQEGRTPAPTAAQLLHAWLSPAYPTGGFAWSHGLETAVSMGQVTDAEALHAFLADLLDHGAGRSDAALFVMAHSSPDDPRPAELATALQPSEERARESAEQGTAFAATTGAVWGPEEDPAPYPVAVGRAAARHGVALEEALPLYLQAVVSNLVSAGIRLIPLGQTEGQRVLARLLPAISEAARRAIAEGETGLASAAYRLDIASQTRHRLSTRLFRS